MEKLRLNLMALIVLACGFILPTTAQACHRSALVVNGYTDLGNGDYQIDLTFSCGAGSSAGAWGASQNTATFAFMVTGGAKIVGYPQELISPQTGAAYEAFLMLEDSALLYDSYLDWWACIDGGCGPIQTVTKSLTIVTRGLPDQIILLGMEGGGNPMVGCTDADMTVDIACNEIAVNAGVDVTVYPGSPAKSCTTLTATASGGSGTYGYLWSNGATTPSIQVCPNATTTYTVTVTAGGTCRATDAVVVNALPCANLVANAGPDKKVYPAYTPAACVVVTGAATGGTGLYSYNWSTGAASLAINACPSTTTTYGLTVTDINSGCTASDQVVVTPVNISCAANKVRVCQYGVSRCVLTSQVPAILNAGGTLGNCGSSKTEDEFGDEAEGMLGATLQAAPNPATGATTLMVSLPEAGHVQIALYDINGREVKRILNTQQLAGNFEAAVDVSDLVPGLYIVRMQQGETTLTEKLMVQ